ncbi:MAG: hypothetical protein KAQ68_11705 [Clostridiales bacterium]|nr:hypothetical protein [Clostridiales bacterium]
MEKTFFVDIENLSPTQFFMSKEKLEEAHVFFENHTLEDYPPLPVVKFGLKTLLTGSHHYAYYLVQKGKHIAEVYDAIDECDFLLNIKNYSECQKRNIKNIIDLESRILDHDAYQVKWVEYLQENREKVIANTLKSLKKQQITDNYQKIAIIKDILNPMPSYFINESIFDEHIQQTADQYFLSFKLFNQYVAFVSCKMRYDDTVEVHLSGIYKPLYNTDIFKKILNVVKRYAKSLGRQYIVVRLPAVTTANSDASCLHTLYKTHGFAHIANLQSSWDERRMCMLLIAH